MRSEDTITAGLAGACVDERGRLIEHPLLDCAARAALLTDLARSDRLHEEPGAVHVDPQPAGWAPADTAVGWPTSGPTTLDGWILTGRLGLGDVVDELVATGSWSRRARRLRRPRYDTGRPRDRWGRTPERKLLHVPGAAPASRRDAAVLALARAAGLGSRDEPLDDVLARTGELRWACELASRVIGQERARNVRAARALRAGQVIGAPG